jgi:23S rRNA maturation-related 3'-5' exoribonuclease YhaM
MQYNSTNLKKPVAEITHVAQHSDNSNGELNMNEKKGEEFMEGTTFIFRRRKMRGQVSKFLVTDNLTE